MKSLSEYLNLMKDIKTNYHDTSYNEYYDNIDLNILKECQDKFRDEYDYHKTYKVYGDIFEKHGIFDNEREFSNFISTAIFNFVDSYENKSFMFICDDINELKNDYFKIIYINFVDRIYGDEGTVALYDETNSINRFNGKCFDSIVINILNKIDKSLIEAKIQHELKHAYQDLNLLINDDSLYKKTLKNILNKYNYNKTDSEYERNLKYVMTILDKYEQDAYISELDSILKDSKNKNIQDGFNKIYKTNIYIKLKWFYSLMNYGEKIDKENIFNIYNKLNETNYNYDKLNSILKNKINKFWSKFINHIYQCVCDHTEIIFYRHEIGDPDEYNEKSNELKNKYLNKSIFIE